MRLAERFGWTLQQLDETDEAELLPALQAERIQTAIERVMRWVETQGQTHANDNDWKLYDMAIKAAQTEDNYA